MVAPFRQDEIIILGGTENIKSANIMDCLNDENSRVELELLAMSNNLHVLILDIWEMTTTEIETNKKVFYGQDN